jgi:carbonic anhydrase
LEGRAVKGLAVLTCIDSRIDPLAMLGLEPGDAKIIRNAGARVTDDALRSLVLAANLLAVERICLVQHTDCAMVGKTDEEVQSRIQSLRHVDCSDWTFHTMSDQKATLAGDAERIRTCQLMPKGLEVGCFIFDVRSGALHPVDV